MTNFFLFIFAGGVTCTPFAAAMLRRFYDSCAGTCAGAAEQISNQNLIQLSLNHIGASVAAQMSRNLPGSLSLVSPLIAALDLGLAVVRSVTKSQNYWVSFSDLISKSIILCNILFLFVPSHSRIVNVIVFVFIFVHFSAQKHKHRIFNARRTCFEFHSMSTCFNGRVVYSVTWHAMSSCFEFIRLAVYLK